MFQKFLSIRVIREIPWFDSHFRAQLCEWFQAYPWIGFTAGALEVWKHWSCASPEIW